MVAPAVVAGAFGLAKQVAGIVDQAVQDKDLALEINRDIMQATFEFTSTIQTSEHVPGYVKFLYALRDVIIPLLRPVGSGLLSAYAVYAAHKGVTLDPVIHGMLAAAFPGWMASRHVNKQSEQRTKRVNAQIESNNYFDMD